MPEPVKIDIVNSVAVITLNRPESRNSLSREVREALITALRVIAQQDDVLVVVLTGSGKAFCAGLDLKELKQDNTPIQSDGMGGKSPVLSALRECPKPIIGTINGYAVTGGFELALACNFLYAAESAQFADTHALVGLMPGWGAFAETSSPDQHQSRQRNQFLGQLFSADDALAWGLVNRVFPDDELLKKTREVAEQISEADPETLRRIRRVMNEGWEMPLGDALKMECKVAGQFNSTVSLDQMNNRLAQLKARSKR